MAEVSLSDLNDIIKELNDSFVRVNGARFAMGATSEQLKYATPIEKPVHIVTLSDYAIAKYPVTQKLWYAVMANNPSLFRNEQNPVENVSWYDCQTFIQRLNKITGNNYRLPTEAQWEFAARGGARARKYKFSGSNAADDVAWTNKNSEGIVMPVGLKKPNELGLYDMSGNIWEWCEDSFLHYGVGDYDNPLVLKDTSSRIIRGGSYDDDFKNSRTTFRDYIMPTRSSSKVGFRLVADTSVCNVKRKKLEVLDQEELPAVTENVIHKSDDDNTSTKYLFPVVDEQQSVLDMASDDKVKKTLGDLKNELAVFEKYQIKVPDALLLAISEAEEAERSLLIDNLCAKMEDQLDELCLRIGPKMKFKLVYDPQSGLKLCELRNQKETAGIAKQIQSLFSSKSSTVESLTVRTYDKKIEVVFEDGVVVSDNNAKQTMAKVIHKLGVVNVMNLNMFCRNIPLITTRLVYQNAQVEVQPGYYLMTYISLDRKKAQLQEIARKLGVKISVKLVNKGVD